MTELWQLSAAVRLRPEIFGGMAFHRQRGLTLAADQELYAFLSDYRLPRPLPPPGHPAGRLVPQLVQLGLLQPADDTGPALRPATPCWPGNDSTHAAPETVHLVITTRCNLACPGCYVPRSEATPEWTGAELRRLIDQWSEMGVFQLAVGGGEPLLCPHLFDTLHYAQERAIAPSLTTNGMLLDPGTVRRLEQAGVVRVNVSWNGPDSENAKRSQTATRALQLLVDSTLQAGANVLVTRRLLPRLSHLLARLVALGVRQVTILRPKPPAMPAGTAQDWYEENRLRRADLLRLRSVLVGWRPALRVEVDCSLVGLMAAVHPTLLARRGIHGCVAGRRICTVWPDGRVTPCSFLADCNAGDARQIAFATLWQQGTTWAGLRQAAATCQPDPTPCLAGGG